MPPKLKLSQSLHAACGLTETRVIMRLLPGYFPMGFSNDPKKLGYKFPNGGDSNTYKQRQIYHRMIKYISDEFKDINDNGGITLTLNFGRNHVEKTVVAHPVIQFIIGDCKGQDVLRPNPKTPYSFTFLDITHVIFQAHHQRYVQRISRAPLGFQTHCSHIL
jgi:hypothetical protein